MPTRPELSPADLAAIRRLLDIDYHEIKYFAEETRLKFNALAPVRTFVLKVRSGGREGEVELFHWTRDDEWEVVHSTLELLE